jgi:alpha-galactosidase
MAAHVKAVQELGFHYVLWVSPFMVGYDSQAAQRHANVLTTGSDRLQYKNLAPWESETQTLIADLMERLVRDYHLDGLKVDFIDSILLHRDDEQNGENGGKRSSKTSVGENIYEALKFATDRLQALKPDILIEYRNNYANLASRAYANIYRSSDVPINFMMNRWQAVMLRLLVPDRAVHLDPAIWHPGDSDANVAVHLINCLVSVPMVSIELDQYPKSHLDLVRYWIGFYHEHRDTIIHGDFKPTLAPGLIPMIRFDGDSETIIALYADVPLKIDSLRHNIWLLNASTQPYIDLSPDSQSGDCEAVIYDMFGRFVTVKRVHLPSARLPVEVGGSIALMAIQGEHMKEE